MSKLAIIIALFQGLFVTGLLAIIDAVIVAINPEAPGLPFSVWFGMLFSIPGLAIAYFWHRKRL